MPLDRQVLGRGEKTRPCNSMAYLERNATTAIVRIPRQRCSTAMGGIAAEVSNWRHCCRGKHWLAFPLMQAMVGIAVELSNEIARSHGKEEEALHGRSGFLNAKYSARAVSFQSRYARYSPSSLNETIHNQTPSKTQVHQSFNSILELNS